MDAVHNKAAISLSFSPGKGGFQFLDLATLPPTPASFQPAFATQAPGGPGFPGDISENPLLDPINNFGGAGAGAALLSASESNNYESINVATTTSPKFFEHAIPPTSPPLVADSTSEDCSTGIALAPYEFSNEVGMGYSQVYLADLKQATFTAGAPGAWTVPATAQQIQTLTNSILESGSSGSSVAQGTHIGVITGEFGGSSLTAI